MTAALPAHWREGIAALSDPGVTAVLVVQCGLAWLRPGSAALRDEIDAELTELSLSRSDVRIDRIVLHSLPAIADMTAGEVAALNSAHAEWLCRLATAAAMLPEGTRPQVHRLIVAGGQRTVEPVDGIVLHTGGVWSHPDAAAAALGILRRSGATTPLTGYDLDMDGPFGDADPSIYL